jgi:hypothetical protein
VDSANTARDFLRRHGIDAQDIQTVWTAIALHTTPGIPQYMHPVIALVTQYARLLLRGQSRLNALVRRPMGPTTLAWSHEIESTFRYLGIESTWAEQTCSAHPAGLGGSEKLP